MLRIAARRGLRLAPTRALIWIPPRQTRAFFGMGEILGVIANPAETIRQLKESKELLAQAREEAELRNEKEKIPKKHTFSKLPGFHGRESEQALLKKILASNPQMTVVFGATSVGKTALLRQVLATDDFFAIKFDLRISGFADLRSLYISLCDQFRIFFEEMHDEQMTSISLTFKHMLRELNEKEEKNPEYKASVADLADLMEMFQSSLLRYWEYEPKAKADESAENQEDQPRPRKIAAAAKVQSRDENEDSHEKEHGKEEHEEEKETFKKRPIVFFMDEAHKLPALVNDQLSLKVFLDTLLVLSKQDRLCHVILATSDSFFQHFLRSMNVGHHSHPMTIGDCTKEETYSYFQEELLETIPPELRSKIDFEEIYSGFGGKLSHISDYVSTWINANGKMSPFQSPIFIQAYTLLQFHLTHASFSTFSPLTTATAWADPEDDTQFSRSDLIHVMRKLVEPPYSLPYFDLCRSIGQSQTDGMIKTRILELRWTKTVSPEMEGVEREWSGDGIERPIVLPMTRIVRRAMEVALREEDQRDESKDEE